MGAMPLRNATFHTGSVQGRISGPVPYETTLRPMNPLAPYMVSVYRSAPSLSERSRPSPSTLFYMLLALLLAGLCYTVGVLLVV